LCLLDGGGWENHERFKEQKPLGHREMLSNLGGETAGSGAGEWMKGTEEKRLTTKENPKWSR